MKDKLKKYLMIVTMAVGILLSTVMPAFAYTGGAGQTETNTSNVGTVTGNSSAEEANSEDAPITEEPSGTGDSEEEESQGRVQGTPLSVPGNGQPQTVRDEVEAAIKEDSKQSLHSVDLNVGNHIDYSYYKCDNGIIYVNYVITTDSDILYYYSIFMERNGSVVLEERQHYDVYEKGYVVEYETGR